jgi:GntR family transcriptional regulator
VSDTEQAADLLKAGNVARGGRSNAENPGEPGIGEVLGTVPPAPKPYRIVRRTSPYPLYWQVEHDLRERIASGVMTPGEKIPSEQELAEIYKTSRITIRQALTNLSTDGLVSREPGRGTFVRGTNLATATRQLLSFTSEMGRFGVVIEAQVLFQGIEPATPPITDRFGIEEGTSIHRLDRLRLADGEPLALQRSRLPADRFPGLEKADLTGSLYDHLLDAYGVQPSEADEVIRVSTLRDDPESAERLAIPTDSSVFLLERLTYDDVGPVDFSQSLVRGDRYHINNRLRYAR